MHLWAITFFLGTLFLSTRASIPSQTLAWLILLAAGILTLLSCRQNWRLLRLPAAFALGFAWAMCYSVWQLSWELPTELEGKDVVIEGVIASIPAYQFPRSRFEFAVKTFNGQKVSTKFSLSWYQKPPPLKVGEHWRLQVRVKRPHAFANPGSFDYEAWLFQQGIRANGYVRESSQNELLGRSRLSYPVDQIRQTINERLYAILGNSPSFAIIQALVIGHRQAMSADQWQVLRATGTNHLMAISGLHISLIAGFAYYLVNFLWRRFARLCLWFPAQQAAAVAAIVAAFFYAALAGFSVPTQRALTMIMVFMLALLWRKNLLPWQGLSLALVVVLIIDPLASLSSGFYLSFAAVAIIFYGVGGRIKPQGLWWKIGRTQWVVTLGLMPLSFLLFQQASLSALLANAIAIPSIGFIVVPLAISSSMLLFISTELAAGLLTVTQYVLTAIWLILTWLSTIPMTQWFIALPSLWVFAAMGVGVLLLLAPAGWPGRWLSALWLLPLVFLPKQVPAHGQAWFTLLDVGQGLSVVVQTRHHVLVFDTGDKLSTQLNAGDAVVLPFLREMGIKKLDSLVISHDHSDHIGGASALLKQVEVSKIYTTALKRFPEDRTIACQYGQQWQWDGVDFKFLYPFDADKMKRNDSCVLKISAGGKQLLLTGDIERAAEKVLANRIANELSADILVAPHHGSKTSSTPDFVTAVSAKTVLFPVGYLNRYNHPSPEVVQRYLDRDTVVYDSIRSGALHFVLAEDDLKQPVQYRLERRRFWQQFQPSYDRRS